MGLRVKLQASLSPVKRTSRSRSRSRSPLDRCEGRGRFVLLSCMSYEGSLAEASDQARNLKAGVGACCWCVSPAMRSAGKLEGVYAPASYQSQDQSADNCAPMGAACHCSWLSSSHRRATTSYWSSTTSHWL